MLDEIQAVHYADGEELWQTLPAGAVSTAAADCAAAQRMSAPYASSEDWNRMSLINIARSGIFAADRAVAQYADTIWHVPHK